MIKSAIEKIISLAAAPTIQEVDGFKYFTAPGEVPQIVEISWPPEVAVSTLTGLVGFIKDLRNGEPEPLIVHIESPDKVNVLSKLVPPWQQYRRYATAESIHDQFSFGCNVELEQFIIDMQATFVPSETVAKILQIVGNLRYEAAKTNKDDGITQRVTVDTGVAQVERVDLPNPVALAPYRTFLEVDQPESQYVFRINQNNGVDNPTLALHTAAGGVWQLKAIDHVRRWLETELETVENVSIIA